MEWTQEYFEQRQAEEAAEKAMQEESALRTSSANKALEKKRLSGCTPPIVTALAATGLTILAGLAYTRFVGDDSCEAEAAASSDFLAAACEPSPEAGAGETSEESEPSDGEDAPEAEGGGGGGAEEGEPIAPPTEAELPEGAKLIKGSGGPIGCIPCDGGFRFLHPANGGVAIGGVGSPAQSQQSLEITEDVKITEFGVVLSGADGGKWEFALHTGPAYVASCHVPQGSTQCKTDAEIAPPGPLKGAPGITVLDDGRIPLKPGDKLAVLVGNPGDPFTEGNFSASWWIVLQPTA